MAEVLAAPTIMVTAPAAAAKEAVVAEEKAEKLPKVSKNALREMTDMEKMPYIQEALEKLLSKKNL